MWLEQYNEARPPSYSLCCHGNHIREGREGAALLKVLLYRRVSLDMSHVHRDIHPDTKSTHTTITTSSWSPVAISIAIPKLTQYPPWYDAIHSIICHDIPHKYTTTSIVILTTSMSWPLYRDLYRDIHNHMSTTMYIMIPTTIYCRRSISRYPSWSSM